MNLMCIPAQTGASIVYTPEEGMNLDTLRQDVKFLKIRYGLDAKGKSEGRLVIRSVIPLRLLGGYTEMLSIL
jgi:hypothetical protein